MRIKILSVDDSKAVRMILKRTFQQYDVELFEAANGIEGLDMAKKNLPDLILLDVTMPEMDGIEMLTRMKEDAQLKDMAVIMLTAEAGRESVLKIAKIGIRDYIVKPFKEDVVIQKVGRIVSLNKQGEGTPAANGANPTNSAASPLEVKPVVDANCVLIVEDKAPIVQQIKEGLSHTQWNVQSTSSSKDLKTFFEKTLPSVVLISLALPDKDGIQAFRMLRSNPETKSIPVLGLVVKLDTDTQSQAKELGFNDIITKPIQIKDLEIKIKQARKEDITESFFVSDSECLIIQFPEDLPQNFLAKLEASIKDKLSKVIDEGIIKILFQIHAVDELKLQLIVLINDTISVCEKAGLKHMVICNDTIQKKSKEFKDCQEWHFSTTVEQAKAALK